MRLTPVLSLVAVVGCGGGHANDPAQEQRRRLRAEEPQTPVETRERLAFRPSERCGQGPYRFETDSLRAHYGEELVVYACGEHAIVGNYRMTLTREGSKPTNAESAFGLRDRDNAACKANRPVASSAVAVSGGGMPSSGVDSGGGAVAAASLTTVQPATLERITAVPDTCTVRTLLTDVVYSIKSDSIALDAHLVVDVWSDEPNDLDGLVFVIEKKAVVADMTLERWKTYLAARDAWDDRWNAFVDGEASAGRTTIFDSSVKTPAPPPPRAETQPPRPSQHARWIPGYWQYADGSFHWLAGLWDVPEEDIQQDLTVHAPSPPPPPRAEQPQEARPTVTAVWTPGQWQWDGHVYVWIAGAWRIPPSQEHTWKPASWSVSARGAIFIPGGWRVSLHR